MKHFAHFIKAGAVRVETKGHWTGASVVFKNPNGEIIILISNALGKKRQATQEKKQAI